MKLLLSMLFVTNLLALTPPNIEKNATCWGDVYNEPCKIRTKDDAVWFKGGWHFGYVITGVIETEHGLQLVIRKDGR